MPIPVLVFDGDCGFCTASVGWLHRRTEFEPVAFQTAGLPRLGLTEAGAREQVWVWSEGDLHGGAAAVAWLLRRSPARRWRVAGALLAAPGLRLLARAAYRLIARHRHRLPGGTSACAVTPPRDDEPPGRRDPPLRNE